jgi:hypothetical protein
MKTYKWFKSWRAFGFGIVKGGWEYEFSFDCDIDYDFGMCFAPNGIYIQIGKICLSYDKYPIGYDQGI